MVCEACFANTDIYRLHYTGTPLRQSVRANSHPHYLIGNYTVIQCVGPLVCITAVLVVAILQISLLKRYQKSECLLKCFFVTLNSNKNDYFKASISNGSQYHKVFMEPPLIFLKALSNETP